MQTQTNKTTVKSPYNIKKFIADVVKLDPCNEGLQLLETNATKHTSVKSLQESYVHAKNVTQRAGFYQRLRAEINASIAEKPDAPYIETYKGPLCMTLNAPYIEAYKGPLCMTLSMAYNLDWLSCEVFVQSHRITAQRVIKALKRVGVAPRAR